MIRSSYLQAIERAFGVNPVVALLGPRQSGKSTLAKQFVDRVPQHVVTFFDLEKESDLAALQNPYLTLKPLSGLVVIDEVQRLPDLFKTLRVIVDESNRKCRLLLLGSASRDLIRQRSETLAGRISYLELAPFSLQEAGAENERQLLIRGGYPLSFLAVSEDSCSKRSFDAVAPVRKKRIFGPRIIARNWIC
jgi:uncharacterized protein